MAEVPHKSPIPRQLTLHEQMRVNLRALLEADDQRYIDRTVTEAGQMPLVKEAALKIARTLPQSLEGIDWSKTPQGIVDLSKFIKKRKKKLNIRGARYPKIMRDIDPPLKV